MLRFVAAGETVRDYDRDRASNTPIRMRTSVDIDRKLIAEAMRVTGAKTMREAVELGLQMLIRLGKQAELRRLRGKVHWQGAIEASRRDG